ncbi:hypothetical protein C8R42DRAFT_369265 [Lentinula raphanica]|nr:hypothetical protein C8R42DRAFT_369265 [Lentinula raphanica]
MSNNASIPAPVPEVPEDQKFDGGIRIAWKPIERKIKVALQAQGLDGYIDGTVKKPDEKGEAGTTKASEATPVFSDKPTLPEWRFRNNRTKGIIESFIADLPSFVPEVDDLDAHKLFDKLVNEFGQKDDMRKTLSMRRLRSHIFREDVMKHNKAPQFFLIFVYFSRLFLTSFQRCSRWPNRRRTGVYSALNAFSLLVSQPPPSSPSPSLFRHLLLALAHSGRQRNAKP